MADDTRKSCLSVTLALVAVPVALIWLLGWIIGLFWLPDAVFRHWEATAQAEAVAIGKATLIQKWRDDFYTTLLICQKDSGEIYTYLIDHDDNRIWECEVEQNDEGIRFLVDGRYEVHVDQESVRKVIDGEHREISRFDDIARLMF